MGVRIMEFYGATDIGRYRSENQDYFLVDTLFEGCVLAVVCDGMGGAAGGRIASEKAATVFFREVRERVRKYINSPDDILPESEAIIYDILNIAVTAANAAVFGEAKDSIDLIGMGTTLVSALVIGNSVYVCNVGDSRLYYLNIKEMRQITRDHSYVQLLIDSGKLQPELAAAHPDKNIITRAVGTDERVTPSLFSFKMEKDEALLLCSDGLSNFITNEVMYSIVWGTTSIFAEHTENKVKKLIEIANVNGGRDNITAVLITY